jgi:GNAT superfamily N-acetyltransferase
VSIVIRPTVKEDESFLWEMLYHAAHMDEEGATATDAAKTNPDLVKYARNWGQETDIGCVALAAESNRPIGATWIRLLICAEKTISYVNDLTPELAIAVLPTYIGSGVGTLLLTHILAAAQKRYPSVVLSVRVTNPAQRLYARMGFVVIGKTTNRVGTESLNMLKQL